MIELGCCVTVTPESAIASELSVTVGWLKVISLYALPSSVKTSKSAGQVIVGGVLSVIKNEPKVSKNLKFISIVQGCTEVDGLMASQRNFCPDCW